MTTAPDGSLREQVDRTPALLDVPQPLGILPTRRFWNDAENVRLVDHARVILVVVAVMIIGSLSPTWWVAGLAGAGAVVLVHGLLERCVRWAAWRRFRARPAALTETSEPPPERAPFE